MFLSRLQRFHSVLFPLVMCDARRTRRTLTSSLWLMDRAECSSALMTDAYESENLVYFPTRAMEHCSSSRSDLQGAVVDSQGLEESQVGRRGFGA